MSAGESCMRIGSSLSMRRCEALPYKSLPPSHTNHCRPPVQHHCRPPIQLTMNFLQQATQNEKKIMGMVGQSERKATIPRAGEWVVQAPLKVKAGRKWNTSQSLSSLADSMGGGSSGAKSRRRSRQPRPFPANASGASELPVDTSVSFGDMDQEFSQADFQGDGRRTAGVGDISRLQADNVLQRRSASATPAPVPLSMPGEKDLTTMLLDPQQDQVFATTSLRDISKSRRRVTSVENSKVAAAPVPTEAFSRLASDMTRMDALGQDVDTEASRVFDGSELDLGPPPADSRLTRRCASPRRASGACDGARTGRSRQTTRGP